MRRVVPKTNILWVEWLSYCLSGWTRDIVFALLFFLVCSASLSVRYAAPSVATTHWPGTTFIGILSDCLYILVWFRGGGHGQWSYWVITSTMLIWTGEVMLSVYENVVKIYNKFMLFIQKIFSEAKCYGILKSFSVAEIVCCWAE